MDEQSLRDHLTDQVAGITPCDDRETQDKLAVLEWISSGAPLYRTAPTEPPMHLAVYAVLLDEQRRELLLVDHIKAGLWVPAGGHVDAGETPQGAVRRELGEELGIGVQWNAWIGSDPQFLTVRTVVVATHPHTDVTLWFVTQGRWAQPLSVDAVEIRETRWFSLDHNFDTGGFDPHLTRFCRKLSDSVQ